MKKIIIILMVIMIISGGIGLGVLYFTGSLDGNEKLIKNSKVEKIDKTLTKNIDGVNKLFIDGTSNDIEVIPYDQKDVKVHLYGESSKNAFKELKVKQEQDVLKVEVKRYENNGIQFGIYSDLKLDVFIPKEFKKDLEIESSSGNITLQKACVLKDLSIDLTSGDTFMDHVTLDHFEYDSSSGNLKTQNIMSKDTSIDVTSGDITMNNFSGNIKASASSGDMDIEYPAFDYDIDLETTSGDIDITLPQTSEFNLDAEVTSGEISCDVPIMIQGKQERDHLIGRAGNKDHKISAQTTSGNIEIHALSKEN